MAKLTSIVVRVDDFEKTVVSVFCGDYIKCREKMGYYNGLFRDFPGVRFDVMSGEKYSETLSRLNRGEIKSVYWALIGNSISMPRYQ